MTRLLASFTTAISVVEPYVLVAQKEQTMQAYYKLTLSAKSVGNSGTPSEKK